MKASIELVTPHKAEKWLGVNYVGNRSISKTHVDFLAREISSGRWHVTGQGIQFDTGGNLIDGQHRLAAIVQSGCTVEMLIVRDVPQTSYSVIDTGLKRHIAQYLRSRGYKYTVQIGAAARVLVLTERGDGAMHQLKVSADQCEMEVQKRPWFEEYIGQLISATHGVRGLADSGLIAAAIRCRDKYGDESIPFFESVLRGENLTPNSAELRLHRYLASTTTSGNNIVMRRYYKSVEEYERSVNPSRRRTYRKRQSRQLAEAVR